MHDSNSASPDLRRQALLLAKLASSGSHPDPGIFGQLLPELQGIALAAIAADQDQQTRRFSIKNELMALSLGDLFKFFDQVDPAQELGEVRELDSWKFVSLEDMVNTTIEPRPYIVRNFISRQSLSIIFGQPKSLKTALVNDLAVCTSIGENWLSCRDGKGGFETSPSIVLWIDLENGSIRTTERFGAFARGHGVKDGLLWSTSYPRPWPDFSKAMEVDAIKKRIEPYSPGLLVIDHFSQVIGQIDENTSQIASVMGNLRALAEDFNLALILIHHQVKNSGRFGISSSESLRGHGSILASCDLAAVVERSSANIAEITIKPVAVRGAPVSDINAVFAYEAIEGGTELKSARFFGQEPEDIEFKVKEAILEVVENQDGINQTALRAEVSSLVPGVGDPLIRKLIVGLENSGDLLVKRGKQQSKLYSLG